MKLFSQREGIKPVKSVIQVDTMDKDLRNGLWNALTMFYWEQVKEEYIPINKKINTLFIKILSTRWIIIGLILIKKFGNISLILNGTKFMTL